MTLAAWLALSCALIGLARFLRGPLDAAAFSSLVVFLAALVAAGAFRASARPTLLASSLLLVTTYYARLFHILSTGNGHALPLPLVTILLFEERGLSVVTLDLGQLGIYALIYLLVTSPGFRRFISGIRSPRSSSGTATLSGEPGGNP